MSKWPLDLSIWDDAQHQRALHTHSLCNTYVTPCDSSYTTVYLIQSHPIRRIWCFCYSWELSPRQTNKRMSNQVPSQQSVSQLASHKYLCNIRKRKRVCVALSLRVWVRMEKRRNLCGHTIHTSKKSYECWKRYKMNLIHIIQKWVLVNIYVWCVVWSMSKTVTPNNVKWYFNDNQMLFQWTHQTFSKEQQAVKWL